MNKETTAILKSLQFLVSMQKPESERYQKTQADIMAKNYLLLNPIKKPLIKDKTEDSLGEIRSKFGSRKE